MAVLSYWHVFGLFVINKQVYALSCLFYTSTKFPQDVTGYVPEHFS